MVDDRKEREEEINEVDPFTRFMFGERVEGRRMEQELHSDSKQEEFPLQHKIEKLLENIDLNELLDHVDKFMSSASELKPLFKKIKPLIDEFLHKK